MNTLGRSGTVGGASRFPGGSPGGAGEPRYGSPWEQMNQQVIGSSTVSGSLNELVGARPGQKHRRSATEAAAYNKMRQTFPEHQGRNKGPSPAIFAGGRSPDEASGSNAMVDPDLNDRVDCEAANNCLADLPVSFGQSPHDRASPLWTSHHSANETTESGILATKHENKDQSQRTSTDMITQLKKKLSDSEGFAAGQEKMYLRAIERLQNQLAQATMDLKMQ